MTFVVTLLSELKYGEVYRFNKKWFKLTGLGSIPVNLMGKYQGVSISDVEKHPSDSLVAIKETSCSMENPIKTFSEPITVK